MKHLYSKRKTQSNNYSGHTGITWNKNSKKWLVSIKYNYKKMHIASFHNIDDAIAVRSNVEYACDSFKQLEVNSFQALRYDNDEYYLLGVMKYNNQPIYIEVSSYVK